MQKEEFIDNQDVSRELANEAWEQTAGDPETATELLEPVELTLKGKLEEEESNIYGLCLVKWDLSEDAVIGIRALVVNVPLTEISTGDSSNAFYQKISELEDTSNFLSGYTDSLKETLKASLEDEDNDYPESLLEGELDSFTNELQENLEETLDLRDLDFQLETSIRRRIDKELEEDDEPPEDEKKEEVNVPACDVQVTPVQGVSVEKLQPDDMIYVELGEIPEDWEKLRPVLEDLRDDTGLIPAQLKSKKGSGDGRMELQVQFGKKVFGTVSCGRDVSLMVPDETREKYENEAGFDPEDLMNPTVVGIAGVLVLIGLLFLLLV